MPELVGPDGDQTKQAEHHRALHTTLMRQVVGTERPVHLLRQPGRQERSGVVSGGGARHRSARAVGSRAPAERGDAGCRGIAGSAGSRLSYGAARGRHRRGAGELGGRGGGGAGGGELPRRRSRGRRGQPAIWRWCPHFLPGVLIDEE